MKVNIYDVAKKSGLSVVTVSRVLNGSDKVRENNRVKVLEAMKELDYRPSAAARSLAKGKTLVIGLIIPTLHDSFFDAIVKEINDSLAMHGYFLALSVSKEMTSEDSHYLIQEDRVDGLILLSPLQEESYISELKRKNIPFVLIDNQDQSPTVSSIVVDNFKGGYDAGKYLLELGHTQIAHLCGSEFYQSTRERRHGFLHALDEAELVPFAVIQGDYGIEFGYNTAHDWITQGKLPTAVFAGDDYIAIGVMNRLMQEGIQVPHDVSVVGFDDQTIASEFRPHLTTIRQPAVQIGRHTVELLLNLISGTSKRGSVLKLEPELIIRDSTAKLIRDKRSVPD